MQDELKGGRTVPLSKGVCFSAELAHAVMLIMVKSANSSGLVIPRIRFIVISR
jgi:hypothetical protein